MGQVIEKRTIGAGQAKIIKLTITLNLKTYSLHLAPNYTDLILAVQFLEIVKENLM